VFVVSVIDDGEERNFVATDLRVTLDDVLIQAGGVCHLFRLVDLIDVLPIGKEPSSVARSPSFRNRRVN